MGFHRRLGKETAAREKHHDSLKEEVASEHEDRGNHHATLNERLDDLEAAIGDSADRQAKEVAGVIAGHHRMMGELKVREEGQGAVIERVYKLEQAVAEDIEATNVKIDSFSSKLCAVKEAWEISRSLD